MNIEKLAYKRFQSIANKCLAQKHDDNLLWNIIDTEDKKIIFDELFMPETFSVAYGSELYKSFSEKQKIFLNQLSYFIQYFRTIGAEQIVINNNLAMSQYFKKISQDKLSDYMYLEASEERDHVKSFRYILDQFIVHYNLDPRSLKNKFLNKFTYNSYFHRTLMALFGPHYLNTYFIARGTFNHQGHQYEAKIRDTASEKSLIHELSKLHLIDEKRHTAVSHCIVELAHEIIEESKHHKLMVNIAEKIEALILRTSFNNEYNCKIEGNIMSNFISQSILFSKDEVRNLKSYIQSFYKMKLRNINMKENISEDLKALILNNELSHNRKDYWLKYLGEQELIMPSL